MPAVQQHPSKEAKDEVLRLYKEGKKLTEITRATGIPRATIYYILSREGIRPNRNLIKTERPEYAALLDKLERVLRDNERLVTRCERLESEAERLFTERDGLKLNLDAANKRIAQLEKARK